MNFKAVIFDLDGVISKTASILFLTYFIYLTKHPVDKLICFVDKIIQKNLVLCVFFFF